MIRINNVFKWVATLVGAVGLALSLLLWHISKKDEARIQVLSAEKVAEETDTKI